MKNNLITLIALVTIVPFSYADTSTASCDNPKETLTPELRNKLRSYFGFTAVTKRETARRKKIPLEKVTEDDVEDYIGGKLGRMNINPSPEDYISLCLNGQKYVITNKLGAGDESIVYEIVNSRDQHFALKIYQDEFSRSYQKGDQLAMNATRKSREFLNIPLHVNPDFRYTITPLMTARLAYPGEKLSQLDPKKVREFSIFQDKLKAALKEDGLSLQDTDNKQNYMYDANGRLWMIDFGSLEKLH